MAVKRINPETGLEEDVQSPYQESLKQPQSPGAQSSGDGYDGSGIMAGKLPTGPGTIGQYTTNSGAQTQSIVPTKGTSTPLDPNLNTHTSGPYLPLQPTGGITPTRGTGGPLPTGPGNRDPLMPPGSPDPIDSMPQPLPPSNPKPNPAMPTAPAATGLTGQRVNQLLDLMNTGGALNPGSGFDRNYAVGKSEQDLAGYLSAWKQGGAAGAAAYAQAHPTGSTGGGMSIEESERRMSEANTGGALDYGSGFDRYANVGKTPEEQDAAIAAWKAANPDWKLTHPEGDFFGGTPGEGPNYTDPMLPMGSGGPNGPGGPTGGSPTGGPPSSSFQQQVRDALMKQLGQASSPVDANDPNLKAVLDPQRVALQRSAERQQSQLAARLATSGLSSSGAADTGNNAIQQQRGESEAGVVGNVLGQEMSAKRNQMQSLLALAVQTGDAESARNIQAELEKMRLQQQESQFGRNLDANQSNFFDDTAYRYAALQAMLNGQAFNGAAGMF